MLAPGYWLALALAAALTACSSEPATQGVPATASQAAESESAAPPRRSFGRLWSAAKDGDAMDQSELSRIEGATGLLSGLASPEHRAVALAALPFAEDAELALAPLAESAKQLPAESTLYLETIARILETPGSDRERLDVEGLRKAFADLSSIARDPSRSLPSRSLALTCLRRLRRWGVGDDAGVVDL